MTPQERADKALEELWINPGFGEARWIELRNLLAAQIEEAEREAVKAAQHYINMLENFDKNDFAVIAACAAYRKEAGK